jgi:hypothetical protein
MKPAAREAAARRAALRRWTRQRFGNVSFAALGLPGGDLVDAGLEDLVARRETVASLLVSLAAPRLRREGVPLPPRLCDEPEMRLYRRLEQESEGLAHARYSARLRQVASFADALASTRRGGRHA